MMNHNRPIPKINGKYDLDFLYHETVNLVFYVISRLVIDDATTKDLAQDTYISAFSNMHQLNEDTVEDFTRWVSRIASNKAKDFLRKKKPLLFSEFKKEDSDLEIEFEDTTTFESPDLLAHKSEVSEMVQQIMAALPEDQRLCIFMFYFEDLTSKEIAETLHVSENTVKSRLRYAKDKIKEAVVDKQEHGAVFYGFAPMSLFVYGLTKGVYPKDILLTVEDVVNVGFFAKLSTKIKDFFTGQAAVVKTVGVVSALSVTGAVVIHQTQKPELIDVFDHISVQFEGYEGSGIASYVISTDVNFNDLVLEFDTSDNLSNEDTVTLRLTDEKQLEQHKLQAKDLKREYTVKGLLPVETIVVEDFLSLTLSGYDKEAKGEVGLNLDGLHSELREYLSQLTLKHEPLTGLKNGDVIKVSITDDSNNKAYKLSTNEVLLKVEDLESVPQAPFVPSNLIIERMENYINLNFIEEIITQSSLDYHGNNMEGIGELEIASTEIWMGQKDGQYISYTEVLINSNQGPIIYVVSSRYDQNIEAQYNTYGLTRSTEKGMSEFKLNTVGSTPLTKIK